MDEDRKDAIRLTHVIDQLVPTLVDSLEKKIPELSEETRAEAYRAFVAVTSLPREKHKEKFDLLYEIYCASGAEFPGPLLTCIVGACFDVFEAKDAANLIKEVIESE